MLEQIRCAVLSEQSYHANGLTKTTQTESFSQLMDCAKWAASKTYELESKILPLFHSFVKFCQRPCNYWIWPRSSNAIYPKLNLSLFAKDNSWYREFELFNKRHLFRFSDSHKDTHVNNPERQQGISQPSWLCVCLSPVKVQLDVGHW